MIHYYTELLGMRDTIEEDDLYVDISKTDLEKQIDGKGAEIGLLQEQIKSQDEQIKTQNLEMQEIKKILDILQMEKMTEDKIAINVGIKKEIY